MQTQYSLYIVNLFKTNNVRKQISTLEAHAPKEDLHPIIIN